MRLVYYSLANIPGESRERQWIQSIRSLRRHNDSIAVWLFLSNDASEELLREAGQQNVHVELLGSYEEFLQPLHSRASILALYPTLHKFLVLPKLLLKTVTQLLYLDCDTFFFDNVDFLFEQHASSDWYAREEPRSRRSPHGYNSKYVDELLLSYIARNEGLRSVPPFNSGVCLMNHGIWHGLMKLRESYLCLVWRLLCGRELSDHEMGPDDPRVRPAVLDAITESDRSDALPYPSANPWIVEQIALWLALGQLPNFSLGTFSYADVCQGGEFETTLASGERCVLAHYFSGCEEEFFAAVPAIAG